MKKPAHFFASYALLAVCTTTAFAQFIGQQQQQPTFPTLDQQRLSPQQQGQILSDIQQHQHRFNIVPQQSPQQFPQFRSQPINFPPPTPQFPILDQERLIQHQNQLLQTQQLLQSQLAQIQQQQRNFLSTLPPPRSTDGSVVQHHTQTSFTPNFIHTQNNNNKENQLVTPSSSVVENQNHQNHQQINILQPRPTVVPILQIEQQIRQLDPEKHKQRIKELREKQAIIEKHNQFVEKQYEKALKKAQADHQEFIEKQKEQKKRLYQRVFKPEGAQVIRYSQSIPRYIYPEEAPLFKLAVEKYYEEHPTTTTTTTTTTAKPTTTTTSSTSRKSILTKKNNKVSSFLPTAIPTTETKLKTIESLEDLNLLQKQYKSQQIAKDDLIAQLRLAIGGEDIAKNLSSREISLNNGNKVQFITTDDSKPLPRGKTEEITLPNGQKVQIIKPDDSDSSSHDEITLPSGQKFTVKSSRDPKLVTSQSQIKTQEITLPNGERVEIIKTTDPKLVPGAQPLEPGSDLEKLVLSQTTTQKPPKEILDELTKGVIPPGANFELLKTGASGGLEQIGGIPQNLPGQKKVTFVLLEEQDDGSLKVQGVKGSGKEKPEVDVDSILKKIKNGEIKLPSTTPKPFASSTRSSNLVTGISVVPNSFASSQEVPVLKTNIGTHFVATSTPASTLYSKIFSSTKTSPSTTTTTTETPIKSSTKPSYSSTRNPHILNHASNDLIRQASTSASSTANQNSIYYQSSTKVKPTNPSLTSSSVSIYQSISPTLTTSSESFDVLESTKAPQLELPEVLKKNGLFAMAKFLRQSGLDTILNETGPYTIFVPTDKAFRTLLVQLGGPEKAEEKFKENPRLLSGLLLHHVIPGAFTIGSLQDEMTGVSLAGTQLRVNQYNMHDVEWNDVKITTINGAKVLEDKHDIEIPQGIAHSIDRVMFPLPVGDIVQTLQSDRERRFTSFLRALFSSGLAETLQGTKTFTLFAPTDKAFATLSSEELTRTVTDRNLARELVFRHLMPTTLYTNGMRYYQLKDSLQADKQLTISKQSGKVKVNNIQLATQNIPATNGVIHAIDSLL